MKFSIIVPVYNVEKYLRRCTDSIVGQTFRDFEVILVDDGSKDSSGEICDMLAETHDYVKVIHKENGGLASARNTGLDFARGEWIVFIDSDDWVEPEMLEVLSTQIDREMPDLVSYNMRMTDDAGNSLYNFFYVLENESLVFHSEQERLNYYFDILLQYQAGWEACGRTYRREIIEEHQLRFTSERQVYAEDYLFTFQYMLYAFKITALCNVFYNYYQNPESLMHTLDCSTILERLHNLAQTAYNRIRGENMPLFEKKFYHLYFQLLNHHIQKQLLDNMGADTLEKKLAELNRYPDHCRWVGQLRRRKRLYRIYMERVIWL